MTLNQNVLNKQCVCALQTAQAKNKQRWSLVQLSFIVFVNYSKSALTLWLFAKWKLRDISDNKNLNINLV